MPTLVSKTYYAPDAAIPPVDVNVPLGIAAHLVTLEFGGYLNSGFLLVAAEQANLGGVVIYTSVINTPLDIQHSTGHDQTVSLHIGKGCGDFGRDSSGDRASGSGNSSSDGDSTGAHGEQDRAFEHFETPKRYGDGSHPIDRQDGLSVDI